MLRPFVLSLLCLPLAAGAQTPIAEARDLPIGTNVTVRGLVTNGSELGSIRYMQDATGGLAVFPGTGSTSGFSPARGSDVTVTGALKLFNGLLEIDPVTAFTVHSTNNTLPVPQVIVPAGLDEGVEGILVRINGCQISGAGPFTSGSRTFTSNGQSGTIFLRTGHPLIGTAVPSGLVDLVGLVSQYSTATPPVGGYQLLLRNTADLITSNTIGIIGAVQQTDILPNTFTLRWNTNLPGTSGIRYGLTPAYGSWATQATPTTTHALPLGGLQPATVYYTRCFAVQGNDTAWAAPSIHSAASPDPGDIIVYFNKSVDPSVAVGPLAMDLGSAIDDTIRAYMDRAQVSLEIVVYNTSNSSIVNAANDAVSRGVQVRWITEGTQNNSALPNLDPAIPLLQRPNAGGSGMHNKFVVVDADGGPAACVLTGSANFTNGSFFNDANNLVIVRDMALARTYRMEFNEMWGSTGPQPNSTNSRFGPNKTNNTPHLFNVGGTPVQCWFSPSDGTTARIADALHSADARIEFALFALTSGSLTYALLDMQALSNVTVRGMLETDDMNVWNYEALLDGGVDVRPDNAPNYLHHKYAIVDRDAPANDPLVITGSHNWSFNAENYNDENTLIIHDASVANQFYQEWAARWTTAVGVDELTTGNGGIPLWPNPAQDQLWFRMPVGIPPGTAYRILDIAGRTVKHASTTSDLNTIDISHLRGGTFVLDIRTTDTQLRQAFIRMP